MEDNNTERAKTRGTLLPEITKSHNCLSQRSSRNPCPPKYKQPLDDIRVWNLGKIYLANNRYAIPKEISMLSPLSRNEHTTTKPRASFGKERGYGEIAGNQTLNENTKNSIGDIMEGNNSAIEGNGDASPSDKTPQSNCNQTLVADKKPKKSKKARNAGHVYIRSIQNKQKTNAKTLEIIKTYLADSQKGDKRSKTRKVVDETHVMYQTAHLSNGHRGNANIFGGKSNSIPLTDLSPYRASMKKHEELMTERAPLPKRHESVRRGEPALENHRHFRPEIPQVSHPFLNKFQPSPRIDFLKTTGNFFKTPKLFSKESYHQLCVYPYLLKNGIKRDTIMFIFTTGDDYIKKAFLRRGWIENEIIGGHIFDIRWDLNENAVNFDELKPGQLCNHFPNNEELTTKTGLARNLQKLAEAGIDPDKFFPRCYDFTEEKAITEFVKDFEQTAVINFVKKHAEFYLKIHQTYFFIANSL